MKKKLLRTLSILTLLIFFWVNTVSPLPTIDEVVSGQADISYTGTDTMNINASDNTIINYTSFSIGENESVIVNRFGKRGHGNFPDAFRSLR